MLELQLVLWCLFTRNLQSPSLGMGCKAKCRKPSPHPRCLSLPSKQLVEPQGKLFPAIHVQHCAAPYTAVLPNLVFPAAAGVTPPVSLPQLPLCLCHLARKAIHCFPQGPTKGISAWPRASVPILTTTTHGQVWQTALWYCSISPTCIWVNREAHLTPRQENPYFYFFQLLLPASSLCRIRKSGARV